MADLSEYEIGQVREVLASTGFCSIEVQRRLIEFTIHRSITVDETYAVVDQVNALLRRAWTQENRDAYDAAPKIKDIERSTTAWNWR